MIFDELRKFFAAVAAVVTTLLAAEAARRLEAEIVRLLTELSSADSPTPGHPVPSQRRRPAPPRTAVAIEAKRVTLRAELIELKNAERSGELVPIAAVTQAFADRLVQARGMMLDLPNRVVRGTGPATVDEADKLLGADLAGIIRCLTEPPIVSWLQ
jgi:hypothetical protein